MISIRAFDSTLSSSRKIVNAESAIYLIRGQRVMLDSDLAAIYGVSTTRLLNSDMAVQASVRVVRAFVGLREMVATNAQLAAKLEELERRLDSHDEAIVDLFAALKRLLEPEPKAKREIGFHVHEAAMRYRIRRG
jgi:hypothetical protein